MTAQGKITSSQLQVGTVVLTEDGSPTARKGRETTPMEVTELGRMNPEGRGRRVRVRVTLTSLDGTEERVSSVSPSQTWWLGSASAHWAPVVAAHAERKARHQDSRDFHRELAEEAKRQGEVYGGTTEETAPAEETAPVHPFGSHPEPNAEMTASDREGELVEVRARGPFEEVQVVRGRIVGQVGGLQNTPGFYVVQHEGTGTYQTYDRRRVVFQIEEEPEPDPVATQPVPPAEAAPAGSSIVATLERVWDQIRANHPDLPAVVIVTGSGMVGPPRWGHFRANGWTERAEKGAALDLVIGEMFVAGETLARGADHTVETMLHEAAHVLARVRDIKDTSRQGRWHNQRFQKLAEELGLEYPKTSAHPQVGYSECVMTPGTREEYTEVIKDLDRAIRLTIALPEFLATAPEGEEGHGAGEHIHHGGRKPRQPGATSTTNNLKAVCGCAVPRIIRASRKVLEEGDIVCGKCREPFEAEASKFDPEGENPTDEDQEA